MVRQMFPDLDTRRARARALVPALVASLSIGAAGLGTAGTARAAMNFCASPALQTSETTQAEPGVQALIRGVDAKLAEQPRAMPHVYTDGAPPHEGIRDPSVDALNDMALMRDAALAWRVTKDTRYLQFVDRFLFAWATTYQPGFNPIDETRFDSLILAYDITASALSVKTRNAAAAFVAKLGAGYVERIDAQKRPLAGTWRNAWQSHRIKLIALSAFTLGDRRMIKAAQRLFVEQIGNNLGKGGTTLDFGERDALHDVVYDLQPLVTATLAARRVNRNWLRERGANGATLAAGLDWLAPYALGERTHEESVRPQGPFDAKRRDAGMPGNGGPWDPKDAAELFHLAARIDGRYARIARQLSPNAPAWLAACLPLQAR